MTRKNFVVIHDDEGPGGGARRWGFAVVIGTEEFRANPDGWVARSKKRLRSLAITEGFKPYNDREWQHMMKVILTVHRGWDP